MYNKQVYTILNLAVVVIVANAYYYAHLNDYSITGSFSGVKIPSISTKVNTISDFYEKWQIVKEGEMDIEQVNNFKMQFNIKYT